MGFGPQVSHGVGGQRHVESQFVRLTRGGFHPGAGDHPGDDHLRDVPGSELRFQVRVDEGPPRSFRHGEVTGPPTQLGQQVGKIVGDRGVARWLLGSSGRPAVDVHQDHRKLTLTESSEQGAGAFENVGERVDKRCVEHALLQIDHDQGGVGVQGGERHGVVFFGLGGSKVSCRERFSLPRAG